jgi:hypothetical protein
MCKDFVLWNGQAPAHMVGKAPNKPIRVWCTQHNVQSRWGHSIALRSGVNKFLKHFGHYLVRVYDLWLSLKDYVM